MPSLLEHQIHLNIIATTGVKRVFGLLSENW